MDKDKLIIDVAKLSGAGPSFASDVTSQGQQLIDRSNASPRTLAAVATELQNAMDAAARVPRLRAELDALLGVVKRVRKAAK